MLYALLPYMVAQVVAAVLIVGCYIWYMESKRERPLEPSEWEPAVHTYYYTAAWVTDSGEQIPVLYLPGQ